MSDFYSFSAVNIHGVNISMEDFKDKTILIVNTASQCGFTPQYKDLEKLYQKYHDQGLVILGFPCNQFGKQEPGTEQNIITDCLNVFEVKFPVFSKVKVNGDQAHPIFKYLKSQKRGWFSSAIKWNFTKFLINSQGKVIKRYSPQVNPSKIEPDILKLLSPAPQLSKS